MREVSDEVVSRGLTTAEAGRRRTPRVVRFTAEFAHFFAVLLG